MKKPITAIGKWTLKHVQREARLIFLCLFFLSTSSSVFSISHFEHMVSMGDSVALKTTVYLPNDTGQYPAVLIRTPYTGSWLEKVGSRFAESGYAAVVQYVRGMSGSEGQFTPFVNEYSDGATIVQWIKQQKWCDGRLAVWGVSYLSFSAFEVARSQDPAIKAMVNISGWADLHNFITRGGTMRLLDHLPWLVTFAAGQTQIPDQAWEGIFRTTPLSQFFKDAEEIAAAAEVPFDFNTISIPILHVTGWNDYIYRSTLQVYHKTSSNSSITENTKLIVGPWTHNQVFDRDSTKYGDADFGESSKMGLDSILNLSVAWFDKYVNGNGNSIDSMPQVQYFIQGANRWSHCDSWPPPNSTKETWYLKTNENKAVLDKDLHSDESWLEFVYDPNNPVPTIGGAVSFRHPFNIGVKDQSPLEGRGDILFFESNPLEEPFEIVGSITVVLYASTDSTDTDFTAKLVEVTSDGYARMIEDGIIRARYNDNTYSASLISPDKVRRYEINLGETAYKLSAGSKIRLEISSGNFPKFDRNPNDGTEPFEATSFRRAHQKIFMSEDYSSSLTLSVLRE